MTRNYPPHPSRVKWSAPRQKHRSSTFVWQMTASCIIKLKFSVLVLLMIIKLAKQRARYNSVIVKNILSIVVLHFGNLYLKPQRLSIFYRSCMTQNVVESRRTPTSRKKSRWANGTLNWHSENTLNMNFFSWLNKCLISMQCIKWAYYRLSSPWRFVYSRLRDEMTALRPKISSDQESLG